MASPCFAMLCHALPCFTVLHRALPCFTVLCRASDFFQEIVKPLTVSWDAKTTKHAAFHDEIM
jgi:hypothetical protein